MPWSDGAGGRIRTCVAVRRRIYSPLELATLPPLHCSPDAAWSPRGDSNPLTCRLQIGCAAIAPLGLMKPSRALTGVPSWYDRLTRQSESHPVSGVRTMIDYIEADSPVNARAPKSLSLSHARIPERQLTPGRPASAVRCVFQHDAQQSEFIADSITQRKVAFTTRRGPSINQCHDDRVPVGTAADDV